MISESLTFYTSQFRANSENSHGIVKMMSQHCAQDEFDEITVRLVPALLQWFQFLRKGRGGGRGRWISSGRRGRRGSWWGIRKRIGRRGWRGQRWIRLNEYYYCSLKFVSLVGPLEIDFCASLRDLPLCMILSEVSFKWMVFSKGWLCIRGHCSINVCFRLLTTGWYVVAKGIIFGLEAKITPERDYSMTVCSQTLFEFHKTLVKCCFWRVSSKQSHCYAFKLMTPIFDLGWMAWVEMCILKGFSS